MAKSEEVRCCKLGCLSVVHALIVAMLVTLVLQTVPVTHSDAVLVAELMAMAMAMAMVMTNPWKSAGWSKNTPCEEGKEVL